MCRFGCIDLWVSCIFHCIYVVVCIIQRICIQYPLFRATIRFMQSSFTPIALLCRSPPSCIASWCNKHFVHIMCAFYMIRQYRIQYTLIRPNHTGYAAVFNLMYLMMIVACYLCCSTSIDPSRVVSRSNIIIIRKFKEVACGIDAALHLKYRRYNTIIWRFSNTYPIRASRRLSIR